MAHAAFRVRRLLLRPGRRLSVRGGLGLVACLAASMGQAGPRPPAVQDTAVVQARVVELVNAARGTPRRCGDRAFGTAPALVLSPFLTDAASRHARDMARRGMFDHRGSDGSQPDERVSRTGYRWRATGENISTGQADAAAVVAGWLASPPHCANIMGPQFTEMGVGVARAPSGRRAFYWVQVFAAPQ